MSADFDIDQTATLLKQRIDQLFEVEAEIMQRKGIQELHGTSLWSEFSDVKKYVWLDNEHVVVIGKSSRFYRIYIDQQGKRTSIFHLIPVEDDNYKLLVLRNGPWIARFDQYVSELAAQEQRLHPQDNPPEDLQDNFQSIDF